MPKFAKITIDGTIHKVPITPDQLDANGQLRPEAYDALVSGVKAGTMDQYRLGEFDPVTAGKEFAVGQLSRIPAVGGIASTAAEAMLPGSTPALAGMATMALAPEFSLPALGIAAASGALAGLGTGHSLAGGALESAGGYGLGMAAKAATTPLLKKGAQILTTLRAMRWLRDVPDKIVSTLEQILPDVNPSGALPKMEVLRRLGNDEVSDAIGNQMQALEDQAMTRLGRIGGRWFPFTIQKEAAEKLDIPEMGSFREMMLALRGVKDKIYRSDNKLQVSGVEANRLVDSLENILVNQARAAQDMTRPGVGSEWARQYWERKAAFGKAKDLARLVSDQMGKRKLKPFRLDEELVKPSGKARPEWIEAMRAATAGAKEGFEGKFTPQELEALRGAFGLTPENTTARIVAPGFRLTPGVHAGGHGVGAFLHPHGALFPFVPAVTLPAHATAESIGGIAKQAVGAVGAELPTLVGERE